MFEIIAVLWVVSPIVLGILLAISSAKKKRLQTQVKEKQQMLDSRELLLVEYRKQNKALQQALREARGANGETEHKTEADVMLTKTEAVTATEPITASEEITETAAESVVANPVDESVWPTEVEKPIEPAKPVDIEIPAKKERAGIAPGSALFGIGIMLILAAGAIFATTTWNILPAMGKIAVLLGAVAVFYGGAFVAEKKLELRNTSITFYILGSTFLAIINLAAGYFEWYGPYYSLSGDGGVMIWSISALITAVSMFVGALIYKTKVLGIIGYYSLIVAVILFGAFAFDDMVAILICVGIVMLLSHAYVVLVEYERDIHVLDTSVRIISYIFHIVATLVCIYRYGSFDSTKPVMWPVIGLVVLAIINLGLAMWRMLTEFKAEDVTNTMLERFECAKVVNIITSGFAIVAFAEAFKLPFVIYQRFYLCVIIFTVLYAVLLLLERKDIQLDNFRKLISLFSQAVLVIAMFTTVWNYSVPEDSPIGIIVLIAAVILYVMDHISGDNKRAVLSSFSLFMIIAYILDFWKDPDTALNAYTVAIISWVIAVAAIVAGRLIYKTIIRKTENGLLIDWLSIGSIIILTYAADAVWYKELFGFIAALTFAAYFASFYKRSNYIADRILLTIATCIAMYVCCEQPFFEIPHEFESEWYAVFILAATAITGFIWRKYKKAVSILWLVVIAIVFANQFETAANYAYRSDGTIGMIKVVIYLAGMIALFIVSYVAQKKSLLIETGFTMVAFSILAWSYEAKGIFILAAVCGVAYLVYLHTKKLSKWAFLPIVQIYVLLFALELTNEWWFVVYAVSLIAGFGLHLLWDRADEKSFADDMVNISAIIPVIVIFADSNSRWMFVSLIMLAVYCLSFYRRYNDNPYALINRGVLTLSSVIVAIAWIAQPWFELSDRWKAEWVIVAFMAVCIFNMIVVYKQKTDELWGWITFAAAVISVVVQGENAIVTGDVVDAIILGVVMLGVLIWAYITKKKQWFMLAGITLIAQSIYASREFWKSIAWWVYLLAAGALLIIIASRSEYQRRKGVEKDPDRPHPFSEWTL